MRRAFPYIVIGIGGFALAYVVISVFVLPPKTAVPTPQIHVADTSRSFQPIDTGEQDLIVQPPIEPPPVSAQIAEEPLSQDTATVVTPDLVGMSLSDASNVLDGLQLRVAVTHDTSSFQPPNTILRQNPTADSLIRVGGTVMLVASYFPSDSTPSATATQRGPALPDSQPEPDTLSALDTLARQDTVYSS
jgi:hypothetical protein